MKQIWKFLIPISGEAHTVQMPNTAMIQYVGVDPATNWVAIWAEVEPDNEPVTRIFKVYGTGQDIPDDQVYQGTAQGTMFMWHVYELGLR